MLLSAMLTEKGRLVNDQVYPVIQPLELPPTGRAWTKWRVKKHTGGMAESVNICATYIRVYNCHYLGREGERERATKNCN